MIAYARKGSIITIQYHMVQPDLADGSGFAAMNIQGSAYTKMGDILTEKVVLLTPSSSNVLMNLLVILRLGKIVAYVLFRPYHEMNGDFFWWSYQERYKDLWIYTWKYITETKKCNNLLWVFSANFWSGNAEKANPRYYYPGHQYVDMLGCDVYTNYGHSFAKSCHDSLRTLGGGKPIAITENGTMPTNFAAWRAEQPYWVYWLTWWGFEGSDKGNTDELYTQVYSDPSVITQDKITPADTNLKIVRVATEGTGTVTKSPNAATYSKGASVVVTATPASGWEFAGWSGTLVSNENPLQVNVTTDYDLTATFKPLPGTVVKLIKNGDFSESATTGWSQVAGYEGAVATGAIVDGEYVVTITNGGTEAWHVQLTQNDIKVEQGKTYTLSFTAHAPSTKEVYVKLGQNGGTYTEYAGKTLNVSNSAQVTSITFTMTAATDPSARIEFNIGKNNTTLYLDNISLQEGTGHQL